MYSANLESFVVISATFSTCAEVLAGIKTEGSSQSHRTRLKPTIVFAREIFRAMCLARVLHHP